MYLTKVVETYRIGSEKEVEAFAKYSSTKKEKKQKGEVVDSWIRFEVTKVFNDEAEPDSVIEVNYNKKSVFEEVMDD